MKSAAGRMSTSCQKTIMRVRMFTLYHRVNCKFKHPPPLSGALSNGNANRRLKLYRKQFNRPSFVPGGDKNEQGGKRSEMHRTWRGFGFLCRMRGQRHRPKHCSDDDRAAGSDCASAARDCAYSA